MSAAGQVSASELSALVAAHYAACGARKDRDGHWQISERWSYGRHLGWVVEHDGYCYDGLEHGADGPFPTREEAETAMADHLREAIATHESEIVGPDASSRRGVGQ